VPRLLDTVTARPDLVRLIGSGVPHGFGGITYALARLATLLDNTEVRDWARRCARYAASADPYGPADWAGGSAGCLAALTAVRVELGESADGPVAGLATSCADRLLTRLDEAAGPGFAFGHAGTAYALATVPGDDTRFATAARTVLARAVPKKNGVVAYGWCSGVAGLAVARASVDPDPDELDRTARLLVDRPVLRDLSLCHGELGIAEALTVLADHVPTAAAARRRAGQVLDVIDRYGPTCGTPGAVSSPGLFNGLAGIGHGLLRLGFAHRVPSVLLVRPGDAAGGKTL